MNLSTKDKFYIAEFIYSNDNDILIKSDAEKVIEVFLKNSIAVKMSISAIVSAIQNNIDKSTLNNIMDDYYSGKLND